MQDKSIVQIGKVMMPSHDENYQYFIQNMFPGENYEMLTADFLLENTAGGWVCRFAGIDLDAVSVKNYLRYGYRKGTSRGGDITFTTKSGDFDKKLRTVQKQVSDTAAFCKAQKIDTELPFFEALHIAFKKDYDNISVAVSEKYKALPKEKQQKSGFTIRIKQGSEEKYLADFETIQLQLTKNGTEGKFEKYKVVSKGINKVCSICQESKAMIYGFGSPYKFSTVDKPGLVSGFFQQKSNWKNYPICSDCALSFEIGSNYIDEKLRRKFYERSFYVIPKTILTTSSEFLGKILGTLEQMKYSGDAKNISAREDFIMREVAKVFSDSNDFVLNLLFFEEDPKTEAMKIKLNLEEIVPSRFRVIFEEVPNQLRGYSLYEGAEFEKKGVRKDLEFSFAILRDFFDDRFYQIIQTVFMGLPLDREVIFKAFMERYRAHRNKEREGKGYFEFGDLTIKKAHMVLAYFEKLGIIQSHKKTLRMDTTKPLPDLEAGLSEEDKKDSKRKFDIAKYQTFIQENPGFLDSEIKEGVFSLGVLTRLLFNLQSANLGGNTPFEKKLKGFHLNSDSLLKIYWEVLNKISQYTSLHAYGDFKAIVADKFVRNAHRLKEISNNQLSFYFVAGIELGKQFNTEEKN